MLALRARELPGLAAAAAREVWCGEESPVLRGEALRGGPGAVEVRRGITLSSPLHAWDLAVMEEGRGRSEACGSLPPVWSPAGPAAFHTRLSSIHSSFPRSAHASENANGSRAVRSSESYRLEDFEAVYQG